MTDGSILLLSLALAGGLIFVVNLVVDGVAGLIEWTDKLFDEWDGK